jgi:uncharacterized LabA/DUF88 family protein
MIERSLVLIDAENVLNSWWTFCKNNNIRARIDYDKLIKKVSEDTNLLRAYFYDGVQDKLPVKKKNFYEALRRQGIQLRTRVLKDRETTCKQCGFKSTQLLQKGVDIALATDILRHAFQKTCDICIIVSGDQDFKDAIEVAKDRGIKVWVVSFKNSLSRELAMTADRVILLDELFDNIRQS